MFKRSMVVWLVLALALVGVAVSVTETQAINAQQVQEPSVCLQWATVTPAPTAVPCACPTVTPVCPWPLSPGGKCIVPP